MGEKLRTKKQGESPRRCRRRRKEEAEGGGRQTDDGGIEYLEKNIYTGEKQLEINHTAKNLPGWYLGNFVEINSTPPELAPWLAPESVPNMPSDIWHAHEPRMHFSRHIENHERILYLRVVARLVPNETSLV